MKRMTNEDPASSTKGRKPAWWQVYVMLPALLSLFLLEMRLPLTGTENILAQLGIVFLIYGFMHIWLRANRRALMGLDEQSGEWQVRVYQFPPAQLPGADEERIHLQPRPLFHLPEAGLKGMLGDTFEVDEATQVSGPGEEQNVFALKEKTTGRSNVQEHADAENRI